MTVFERNKHVQQLYESTTIKLDINITNKDYIFELYQQKGNNLLKFSHSKIKKVSFMPKIIEFDKRINKNKHIEWANKLKKTMINTVDYLNKPVIKKN